MNTRFKRLLKLRDIEFFNIIVNDDDRTAFLLIYDERRPQKQAEDGNHIKLFLISTFELSEAAYEDVLRFNDDLLDMKYNCSYFMESVKVAEEFEFDFPFEIRAIRTYVEELVHVLKLDVTLPELSEKDFNYLSQD